MKWAQPLAYPATYLEAGLPQGGGCGEERAGELVSSALFDALCFWLKAPGLQLQEQNQHAWHVPGHPLSPPLCPSTITLSFIHLQNDGGLGQSEPGLPNQVQTLRDQTF